MENAATNNTGNKYNPQEFVSLADKAYLDTIKNGGYKDIIAGMANLGDYSLRNQMLILNQLPTATKVNTMNGWNYQKRSILKGSQSIKILAPVFDSVVKTENGNVVTKQSDYASGYKISFVFDISQTESKNLDEIRSESESLELNYDVISKALKETLKSYEFKTADIEGDGMLDTRRRTVTLKNGMDKEQTLRTLIDQVAAALVLGRDRNKFRGLKSDALPEITAIEITAVSNIVARRLGLEGGKIQEPDFKDMNDEDIDKFSGNINLIRSVSQIMIQNAENAMGEALAMDKIAQEQAAAENAPGVEAEPQEKSKTTVKTTTRTKVKAQAEMI